MKDLIAALTILAKYTSDSRPTHCEHDILLVLIDPALVPEREVVRLEELGFYAGEIEESADEPCFYSFRFGSS